MRRWWDSGLINEKISINYKNNDIKKDTRIELIESDRTFKKIWVNLPSEENPEEDLLQIKFLFDFSMVWSQSNHGMIKIKILFKRKFFALFQNFPFDELHCDINTNDSIILNWMLSISNYRQNLLCIFYIRKSFKTFQIVWVPECFWLDEDLL